MRKVLLFLVLIFLVSCNIPFSRTEEFNKDIPAINIGETAPEISIEVDMPEIIFKYNIELESAELFYYVVNNTDYDCDTAITLDNITNNESSEIIKFKILKNSKSKEESIPSTVIMNAVNRKNKSIKISFKNSMGSVSIPGIADKSIQFYGKLKIKGKFSLKKIE